MVYDHAISAADVNTLYYGGLCSGDELCSGNTALGEQWKAGYQTSSGTVWSSDTNSNVVTITS